MTIIHLIIRTIILYLPVFMCYEEGTLNVTTVWILTFTVKHLLVVVKIIQIDSSIESKQNDLGRLKEK